MGANKCIFIYAICICIKNDVYIDKYSYLYPYIELAWFQETFTKQMKCTTA